MVKIDIFPFSNLIIWYLIQIILTSFTIRTAIPSSNSLFLGWPPKLPPLFPSINCELRFGHWLLTWTQQQCRSWFWFWLELEPKNWFWLCRSLGLSLKSLFVVRSSPVGWLPEIVWRFNLYSMWHFYLSTHNYIFIFVCANKKMLT